MSEHFSAAVDLETAVIRGMVDEGRQHAAWLASHEPHRDLPFAGSPYLVAVRMSATEASESESLNELAVASARLASACGSCHSSVGGGLQQLPAAPPDESEELYSRMARHVWATDRMWEALLEHSEALWSVGHEVLAASAVTASEASWDPQVISAIEPIVTEIIEVADQASRLTSWDDRSDLVGSLLTTCSRCHEQVGIDPLGRAGIGGPLP